MLLHPRPARWRRHVEREHPRLAATLLAHVMQAGEAHPRDVAAQFGRGSVVNGWGGQSSATTRVLEALHHRGQLRVARRANGVKVYAPARPRGDPLPAPQRARALLHLLLALYAPLPEGSLRELARMVTETSMPPLVRARALEAVLRDDAVASTMVDGMRWLWPAQETIVTDVPAGVHLLAPFDPVVWDRRRFGAFWGWDYRFEAYTPPARRRYGYYALPLLWRDRVVGWANAALEEGRLAIAPGYVGTAPRDRGFRRELAAEAERLAAFLDARDVDIAV